MFVLIMLLSRVMNDDDNAWPRPQSESSGFRNHVSLLGLSDKKSLTYVRTIHYTVYLLNTPAEESITLHTLHTGRSPLLDVTECGFPCI